MLQFIAEINDKYTLAAQAKAVIDGGCQWIIARVGDNVTEDIKKQVTELTDLCRESSVILTFEDNVELVKELGVHGVHLTHTEVSAASIRDNLGAEAIIGINVRTLAGLKTFKASDIDYAGLSAQLSDEERRQLIVDATEAGSEVPLVRVGDFTIEDIPAVMSEGVNGVATGRAIIEAENPSEYFKQMLSEIMR
jgi:thiamine-phosphate pyrophosphorylase